MNVHYTIVDSPLGRLLVAATSRGVCAVAMGRSDATLRRALALEYPGAAVATDRDALSGWTKEILAHLSGRRPRLDLPLDVQATAFQWQVWTALPPFPAARRARTRRWPARSAGRAPRGPSRARARRTRSRWRFRVIASCRRRAASAAIAGARRESRRCSAAEKGTNARPMTKVRPIARGLTVSQVARPVVSPPARPARASTSSIVGGGLTGCATAYAFAAAGHQGGARSKRDADRPGQQRIGGGLDRRRSRRRLRSRSRRRSGAARRGTPGRLWRRAALDFARAAPPARHQVPASSRTAPLLVAHDARAGGAAEARTESAARRGPRRARRSIARAMRRGEAALAGAAALREPRRRDARSLSRDARSGGGGRRARRAGSSSVAGAKRITFGRKNGRRR